jgi:hypothetical protein
MSLSLNESAESRTRVEGREGLHAASDGGIQPAVAIRPQVTGIVVASLLRIAVMTADERAANRPMAASLCVTCGRGRGRKEQAGKRTPRNREMKEGPTMLLITKDRLPEPTMFMNTNQSSRMRAYEAGTRFRVANFQHSTFNFSTFFNL